MNWKDKMKKSVDHLEEQLRGIRPGNVSIGFIETFKVPYYGSTVPISQVAAINCPPNQPGDGQRIHITPYDISLVSVIEKTLSASKLNAYKFNPKMVCVAVPPMSGEQRADIAKHIKKLGEDAKVAIRSIRQAARDDARKVTDSESLSGKEAVKKQQEAIRSSGAADKEIQQVTDQMIAKIEQSIKSKIEEIK